MTSLNHFAMKWSEVQTLCGWFCTNSPSATASPTYYTPLSSARWRSPATWAWNPSSGRTTPATTRAPSGRWDWTAGGRTTLVISTELARLLNTGATAALRNPRPQRTLWAALWPWNLLVHLTDLLLCQLYLQAVDLLLQILVFLLVGINFFQTFSVFPLSLVL